MTAPNGPRWTQDELRRIGDAEELQVSSRRADGNLRPFVTIWGVRAGDEIYVRSAHGADNPWFQRAVAAGVGAIRAAGKERPVTFELVDPARAEVHAAVDAAYHTKYDRYGPQIVNTVVGSHATTVTLRVTAHD